MGFETVCLGALFSSDCVCDSATNQIMPSGKAKVRTLAAKKEHKVKWAREMYCLLQRHQLSHTVTKLKRSKRSTTVVRAGAKAAMYAIDNSLQFAASGLQAFAVKKRVSIIHSWRRGRNDISRTILGFDLQTMPLRMAHS